MMGWEDCVKRYLAGMENGWRMRARDGGMETVDGDDSETGTVTKKKGKKWTTNICASLTPDYREKEESNNMSVAASRRRQRMGQDESRLAAADPDRLELLLNLMKLERVLRDNPAGEGSQIDHAWDADDCSPNLALRQNGLVAVKTAFAETDVVRGKQGYSKGIHIWEITWKKEHRGPHAVIGVASYNAPLTCSGHCALLGSNDESLGWNIVANASLFNDCVINKYPDDVQPGFQAPDVILVILNMDEGTLGFKSGVDGTNYGLCLSGLRAFSRNGQKLYPAISVTKQGAEIGIKGIGNGIVLSNRTLKDDEYFEVKLEKKLSIEFKYSLDIGVTTISPEKLNFPDTMTSCQQGQTWMLSGSKVVLNRHVIKTLDKIDISKLEVGDTVSLKKTSDGKLFIYKNRKLAAELDLNIPPNVYAVADVYGKAGQVSIAANGKRRPSTGPASTAMADDVKGNVDAVKRDLTTAIGLLKSEPRDTKQIPAVGKGLDGVSKLIQQGKTSCRHLQMLGDCFVDLGGAKAVSEYMAYLKTVGINRNQEAAKCYLACLDVILYLTHSSLKLAGGLADTSLFKMLLDDLDIHKTSYQTKKVQAILVVRALAILYNCSQPTANREALRRDGAERVLANYSDAAQHEISIILFAFLFHVNIVLDSELHDLDVPAGVSTELVRLMGISLMDTEHHSATTHFATAGLSFPYDVAKQVRAICTLGKNPRCRQALVMTGLIKHLVKLMEVGDQMEQELACNAVWELLSSKTYNDIIQTSSLAAAMKKLKMSGVEEVVDAVNRLQVKLNQLAERIRGGGACQQIHPSGATVSRDCNYRKACHRYFETLGIQEDLVNRDWNTCYCSVCHAKKEDNNYYSRGHPPKSYGIPIGWCRIGLHTPARAMAHKYFETWHRAFHGTKAEYVAAILKVGDLLVPGDVALGGKKIGERPGHFDDKSKPDGFDTKQIFVSPSIRYAGHNAYATPARYEDKESKKTYNSRVALQVLISPNCYQVGAQTTGATQLIDPNFSNQELEWSTVERGSVIVYGLLIRLDETQE
ncbi:SPRY domain-containing SOCS box protein 2 [Lamellibrachia satsuma]|nr:SPRY domain-containing SOCS box protein 2 [Lamellibrachia satsuma]